MLQFRAATAIGSLKPKEAAQDRRCLAHRRAGKTRWLVEHDLPKDGNIIGGRIGPKRNTCDSSEYCVVFNPALPTSASYNCETRRTNWRNLKLVQPCGLVSTLPIKIIVPTIVVVATVETTDER